MSTSSTPRRYLSVAETAKLVRRDVKTKFPETKFSVRSSSYSMGASITVKWTDGPTTRQVDEVVQLYAGASFDGMIDLKSYHDSLLSTDDGFEVVHFGADFIHTSRQISPAWRKQLERELERFTGQPYNPSHRYEVSAGHYGNERGELARDSHQGEWGSTLIHQMAYSRPRTGKLCPGGDESYCPGCGRWQGSHRAPHLA